MGDAETEEHQARAMRQPLVAQYDLRVPPRRVCTAACCFSLKCAGIALLASVLFVFIVMVADGMFRKVNERTPELRNGTVTEPNTGTEFPVYIPGPRGTTLDAVGVSLWVEHIPLPFNPTVRVAAVAMYVEKSEGRRRLRAFKARDAEASVEPALKKALMKGGMGEALRYVVAGTPPGDVMMSGWVKSLKAKMKENCPDEDADKLAAAFKGFFTRGFRKGDDFTFERRPGEELYAHYAGKPPELVSSNACLGRALLEDALDVLGKGAVNLLKDLWLADR